MSTSPMASPNKSTIAYFCMEVGLNASIPTYSGGLGILAGDTLKSAADLGIPMAGVTLLHRKGYVRQRLDEWGNQHDFSSDWRYLEHLEALPQRVFIEIEGRQVVVRALRYLIRGATGQVVPVYFLDTALPENTEWDRGLTDRLYGGDSSYRLRQEALLGLGGVAMLKALGYNNIQTYHMNEGHCAFLTLPLLRGQFGAHNTLSVTDEVVRAVQSHCVFTTHTPVAAGHDEFLLDDVQAVLGKQNADILATASVAPNGTLNMSHLALALSGFVNGVSQRHGQVARELFKGHPISSIANGVHAVTWTSPSFSLLYDRYIPKWRKDNMELRRASDIPLEEIQKAHSEAKAQFLREVERRTGVSLNPEAMTIGFARRAATYKRADLLLSDVDRLMRMALEIGPIQVVYAGKAHPRDEAGKDIIRRIFGAAETLRGSVPVLYLEDYDISLGKLLCTGSDLWLNTPEKPMEASGTSGMKAAINGVPSLSVLDGWWVEGHIEGVTGWSVGDTIEEASDPIREAGSIYEKLESIILPTFYHRPNAYAQIMRSCIALNGSLFNAHRMMRQYLDIAYTNSTSRHSKTFPCQ